MSMTDCPNSEALANLLRGGLDPTAAASIRVHLEGCGRCLDTMDRLSDDTELDLWMADGGGDSTTAARRVALDGLRASTDTVVFLKGKAPAPAVGDVRGDLGVLGPFTLEAEIGRGGMGVVYRARDRTMGRCVALKILRPDLVDDRARGRFVREVRAAARVEHDHVVRVYATSDPAEPTPYFAMEFVDGPSLAERIRDDGRLGPRAAAEIIAQAADGLAAAHAAGLVHRDVKPANILIESATGRAKIGDFGLARIAAEAAELTREGVIAGTPAYLSPEQAKGEASPDARTDVYALGVSLYECLAGECPFRGSSHRIVHQVLNDEPRSPRAMNDRVSRDLETICLKAMAKEPDRRYATISEFGDDLRRFLRGEPIRARPVSALERGWRWSLKNPMLAGLGIATVLLLIAMAAGSTIAAVWIAGERTKAVDSATLARAQAIRADEQAHRADAQRELAMNAFSSLVTGVQEKLGTRPGTLELRRSLLETARAGLSKIAADGDARADPNTLMALKQMGDLDLILGRTADAKSEFERAAKLAERLVANDPQSVTIRRELAASYDRMGDLSHRNYVPDKNAADQFQKAFAIRQTLVAERPEDPVVRRDLRVSYAKLGDCLTTEKDFDGAIAKYETALKLLDKETPGEGPSGRILQLSDRRFINNRIGAAALYKGDTERALDAMRQSLAQAEALCATDSGNPVWRRERAVAWDWIGTASLQLGDLATAETNLRAYLADRLDASRADPANAEVSRAAAMGHQHLGDLHRRRRDFAEARSSYLAARAIYDELAKRDPKSLQAHIDRSIILRWLGMMEGEAERFEEAARWIERELELHQGKDLPPQPGRAAWIAEAQGYLICFQAMPRAIEDVAFARSQPAALAADLHKRRAVALARHGRHVEAVEALNDVLQIAGDPTVQAVAARVFAIAAGTLAPDQAELRASYTASAVEHLRTYLRADPKARGVAATGPDFQAIRDDPAFVDVIREKPVAR